MKVGGKYTKAFLKSTKSIIAGIWAKNITLTNKLFTGFKFRQAQDKFYHAFETISNAVRSHLDDGDLTGAIRDIHGYESNGQHLKEVTEALNGMKKQLGILKEHFNKGDYTGEAKDAVVDLMKQTEDAIKHTEAVLDDARKSASLQTK